MRRRLLASLALLPLIGAAPIQAGAGATVECRLSYADANTAVTALNITRSSGEDPEGEGGVTRYFNAAGATVLGQPASTLSRSEFASEGRRRTIFRANLPGAYPAARTAMLTLHGKASCDTHESTKPGELGCMIHVRAEGSDPERDVDMILFEHEGAVYAGCIFSHKQ